MTNFISIYVTNATAHLGGRRLVGLSTFVTAIGTGAATVKIHCGLTDDITLATSVDGAAAVVDAINEAVNAHPGGNVVAVNLPSGVTVTSFTLA